MSHSSDLNKHTKNMSCTDLKLSGFKVVSRNCANNTINPSLYGGCIENTSKSNSDILFHQEVPKQTFSNFKNPIFTIENDTYMSFFKICGRICGVTSQNVGMSSMSKGEIRIPKAESHCTVLVWNDSIFNFMWTKKPTYMETSLLNGITEIGIRSTLWVAIEHKKTKKIFVLISVHANAGNVIKRSKLLESIFRDADDFEKLNLYPIIAGDFNEKPDVLNGYLKTNLQSSWNNSVTDVTHINYTSKFIGHIDYIFSSKKLLKTNAIISGIDQNNKEMTSSMKLSGNDHAIVSQIFL
jgi:hypothetical protein